MVFQSIINSSVLFEECIVRDGTEAVGLVVRAKAIHSSILTISRVELIGSRYRSVFHI